MGEGLEDRYRTFGYRNCAGLHWYVRVVVLNKKARRRTAAKWLKIEVTQYGDINHVPRKLRKPEEAFAGWLSDAEMYLAVLNAIYSVTKPRTIDGKIRSYRLFINRDGRLLGQKHTSSGTEPN